MAGRRVLLHTESHAPRRGPKRMLLLFLGLSAALAACTSVAAHPPSPNPMIGGPPASTTTQTVPPAASPTTRPQPSAVPTSPSAPILFLEPFDESGSWTLGETDSGASRVSRGQLTISVRQSSAVLLALAPTDPLADIEAEILVRPQVCSPGDEFGMVLRYTPLGEHYRIALTCDGTARIVRVLADQTRSLVPLTPSSAIIPGAGATNRLRVISIGPAIQVLVNGQGIISIRDNSLSAGQLGLFAHASRGGQVTVQFDDLLISAAETTEP
jgi:hypothetical protein